MHGDAKVSCAASFRRFSAAGATRREYHRVVRERVCVLATGPAQRGLPDQAAAPDRGVAPRLAETPWRSPKQSPRPRPLRQERRAPRGGKLVPRACPIESPMELEVWHRSVETWTLDTTGLPRPSVGSLRSSNTCSSRVRTFDGRSTCGASGSGCGARGCIRRACKSSSTPFGRSTRGCRSGTPGSMCTCVSPGTLPCPVPKIWITDPGAAAFDGLAFDVAPQLHEPIGLRIRQGA